MKVGDAVKFIGFSGMKATSFCDVTSEHVGLVLRIYRLHRIEIALRVNVLWPDGRIGHGLFEETLEVINDTK